MELVLIEMVTTIVGVLVAAVLPASRAVRAERVTRCLAATALFVCPSAQAGAMRAQRQSLFVLAPQWCSWAEAVSAGDTNTGTNCGVGSMGRFASRASLPQPCRRLRSANWERQRAASWH